MREYLVFSPDYIANEIRLKRNYHDSISRTFLLVEGSTDDRVYKRFIDKNMCEIIIGHNKDNVLNVLTILETANFTGVLAIVDADFMVLEGEVPASPNLLFTDHHDLEMMMLNSPAFEKVLDELGSTEKIERFKRNRGMDLIAWLLRALLPLGYLRWLSLRENLAFKFEGLKFKRFIDEEKLLIDIKKLIRNVQEHTSSHTGCKSLLSDEAVEQRVNQLVHTDHNMRHVCCGHDVINLLSIGLRKVLGSLNVEPDQIERDLRLAYEHDFFKRTRLFVAIQQWETCNIPFALLRQEG